MNDIESGITLNGHHVMTGYAVDSGAFTMRCFFADRDLIFAAPVGRAQDMLFALHAEPTKLRCRLSQCNRWLIMSAVTQRPKLVELV